MKSNIERFFAKGSMYFRAFGWIVVVGSFAVSARAAEEPVRAAAPAPSEGPPRESTVTLPELAEGASLRREIVAEGYRVQLDLANQVLAVSLPDDESWREPGELRENDVVEVAASGATLMSGKTVLARLAKGQALSVGALRGDWLSASVPIADAPANGRIATGWVRKQYVRFLREESPLQPTPAELTASGFVPASLLIQKAKQFDDGLYAAVELAAQRGAGKFAGKQSLLSALARQLGAADSAAHGDGSTAVVLAAARLAGLPAKLPPALEHAVAGQLAEFNGNPLRSKPLAFYTWSDDLAAIFRQDRMLQTPLRDAKGIEAILDALRGNDESRATYERYLQLVSKLTNPLAYADLRPQLAASGEESVGAPPNDVYFFPPSMSHETELVKRLFGDQPIPDGFDLADALIAHIRAGEIDLAPRPESGWYDYQTWSQEPLLAPDATAEAEHLEFDDNYRRQLVDLFKGALALARETHIKQLEVPPPSEAAGGDEKPRPEIYIQPELTAEPLATLYQRRAIAYRFVRAVLEEAFGPEGLAQMHRLTAGGPVETNLADELAYVESLFRGAYVTVSLQLGLTPETPGSETPGTETKVPERAPGTDSFAAAGNADDSRAAAHFLAWAANLDRDPDLGQDARMMVPVFYDSQRRFTKVWAFLGWTTRQGWLSFAEPPAATSYDEQGEMVAEAEGPLIHFHSRGMPLVYPVTAEVYVSRLLDRDEFRRHCDLFRTRDVILANLK